MKRAVIAGLIFLFACVGGNYSTSKDSGYKRNPCANIPVGVERYQYMDPLVKSQKISCADVEACAALTDATPPNVPCE